MSEIPQQYVHTHVILSVCGNFAAEGYRLHRPRITLIITASLCKVARFITIPPRLMKLTLTFLCLISDTTCANRFVILKLLSVKVVVVDLHRDAKS